MPAPIRSFRHQAMHQEYSRLMGEFGYVCTALAWAAPDAWHRPILKEKKAEVVRAFSHFPDFIVDEYHGRPSR